MLQRIVIHNFRGIHDLTIDDLSAVNIFIGRNASGKTTVLESIYAISQADNPGSLMSLTRMPETAVMMWPPYALTDAAGSLFRNLDPTQHISFDYWVDDKEHHLSISQLKAQSPQAPSQQNPNEPVSMQPMTTSMTYIPDLAGITIQHKAPEAKTTEVSISLRGQQVFPQHAVRPDNTLSGFYVDARKFMGVLETAATITHLMETKTFEDFLAAVKSVDGRIKNITPGFRPQGYPIVLVDIGLPRSVPMNILGDGLCRIILMVTGMFSQSAKLLIVDEVDSGLHRSLMPSFWNALIRLSESHNFQYFASTHNEEMLTLTLEAFANHKEALRIFRLERNSKDEVSAQKYTYDLFKEAVKAGFDIR